MKKRPDIKWWHMRQADSTPHIDPLRYVPSFDAVQQGVRERIKFYIFARSNYLDNWHTKGQAQGFQTLAICNSYVCIGGNLEGETTTSLELRCIHGRQNELKAYTEFQQNTFTYLSSGMTLPSPSPTNGGSVSAT